jgi:hypothetical protein
MKLSSTNPLGGFTDALKAALDGVRSLRDELAKLGAPKAIVPEALATLTPSQLLDQDYRDVLADRVDPRFAALDSMRYQDDIFRRNPSTGALNVVVSIDPNAAAYGIGVASVNNSANGNSNNYSTIQSFQGGVSF